MLVRRGRMTLALSLDLGRVAAPEYRWQSYGSKLQFKTELLYTRNGFPGGLADSRAFSVLAVSIAEVFRYMFSVISRPIGKRLAAFLSKNLPGYRRLDSVPVEKILPVLQTGDIILVEGNSRISVAIKYLSQSSWSHAAIYVGASGDSVTDPVLLEADLEDGVRLVSLDYYRNYNLRICRAVDLNDEERTAVIEFARQKLGHQYDLKNVFDLVRYLIQRPAVPNRYRRAMIGFGSGEPTRAICSTLIAEAFQSIGYPILPVQEVRSEAVDSEDESANSNVGSQGEVPQYYRRHFTHFTPRDFDLSPYFRIIKPTIEAGFDFHEMRWLSEEGEATASARADSQPRS